MHTCKASGIPYVNECVHICHMGIVCCVHCVLVCVCTYVFVYTHTHTPTYEPIYVLNALYYFHGAFHDLFYTLYTQ
jgi:hypothetical protein